MGNGSDVRRRLLGRPFGLVYLVLEPPTASALWPDVLLKALPLIYAIAFCSLQYSRERRLEEEYAFKSSISISLEPYQKLVEGLIKKESDEELAKYSAFIIESIGRVFTSPTGAIFDDHSKDASAAAPILKAVEDILKIVVKR